MVELVAKRYGSAIFELAKEKDAVTLLKEEILGIREVFSEKDLREMLTHPKIAVEKKIELLEESLTGRISHDLLGLLVLIIRKGRQLHITDIFDEVLTLIDDHDGKVKAYITSPDPLDDDQKKNIIEELAKQTEKEVIPVYEVDPDIIGGLIIRIGDRIVDNSIKGHLHTLSRQLLDTKL